MNQKPARAVDVEGRTIKEAIRKGLVLLGVQRSQVTVQVLAEESQGLFGMRGAKPAKVRMVVKGAVGPKKEEERASK